VLVDVLFDPFGGRWPDLRDAAIAAEAAGFAGVWTYDHLAGSVHGEASVLECWTTLTALAVAVPRITVGSLVLNVANRDAGTLAVMAATLQHVSDGRVLLGVGAGGGPESPYAAEQVALGRPVLGAAARRQEVDDYVGRLRAVWSGATGGASGFLRPEPPPPVIVAGFGPKMAALAGRVADGINTPGGPGLPTQLAVARRAREEAGRDPSTFLVTTSARPAARDLDRLRELGVDRAIIFIGPPYGPGVSAAARALT
jgi:alkanesulfonate monooxygenase SsuD/methylene tetrahydromethanopterin reductase-like flavin-dependent oxidoreductase (luciferase family)